ncbi:hypothetical protein BCR42DRAFT_451830 [Absidia repens]|uniref:Uncharacterized protein n=1 Tax=Absidia repens TaxID=90262 RepID=A0A1X2IGF2_9FUNG|nr:hypothetical protein BCR42DRAFT_451830 [Absidia repens]
MPIFTFIFIFIYTVSNMLFVYIYIYMYCDKYLATFFLSDIAPLSLFPHFPIPPNNVTVHTFTPHALVSSKQLPRFFRLMKLDFQSLQINSFSSYISFS